MNAPIMPDIAQFDPPSLDAVERATALARLYFRPQYVGLDNVNAAQPALYVSNHTIYGVLDSPLLYEKLYKEKGIVLRSLGDHLHFDVPVWRDILQRGGTVPGTPENCARLMQAGEHILVYPGGGREVAKRKGEQNKLTWKTRTGFARMAIEHQYPIIPVAALGADDAFDVVYDAYDFMQNPLGRWLLNRPAIRAKTRNGDMLMPIAKGIGPTLIPRPEKFYFAFGKPISPAAFSGKANDKEQVWQLRKQVMEALEGEMEKLRQVRAKDKDVSLLRRLLTRHG
jgi:1-acyl-sn-glycerol-3-phosphate acyltransferase